MGTPFDTIHAPTFDSTIVATNAQLRLVSSMLTERDWTKGVESWVKRVAIISATLGIAEQVATDPGMAESLKIDLTDRSDLWMTFHELMRFGWGNAVNDDHRGLCKPLTKAGASKLIDYLSTLPLKPRTSTKTTSGDPALGYVPSAEVVPAGRYAIDTYDGAHNGVAFYKIDRPTEGKWAGRVFVKLMISDDEQRIPFAAAKGVLRRIAEVGAEAASARYGHEIGECGMCGRTLTNDESRARGIGPVCAAKAGW